MQRTLNGCGGRLSDGVEYFLLVPGSRILVTFETGNSKFTGGEVWPEFADHVVWLQILLTLG
jgi:hypothetical protein